MTFLNTLFLWALPLAVAPIVIHLLNRRQRKTVQWSAMRFLQTAAARRRRLWRLSDLLLMLLRAAALALIVFALAQPMIRLGMLSESGPRDVVLVIDNSLSTARKAGGGSVLDLEIAQARKLLGELTDRDTIRVMTAGGGGDWLAPVARQASRRVRSEIDAQLVPLKPSAGSADLLRAMSEALETEPADPRAFRLFVLLTDGREYGWRAGSPDQWAGLKEKLGALQSPAAISVVNCGEGIPPQPNLAINSLEAPRTILAAGDALELTATVRNAGTAPSEATTLAWSVGKNSAGLSSVPALPPGDQVRLTVRQPLDSPGVQEIACQIQKTDAIDADNISRIVVEVLDSVPILVVDGASTGKVTPQQADRGDAAYLLAALGWSAAGLPAEWQSIFKPTIISPDELATAPLDLYRVIVLCNAIPLKGDAPRRLAAFVRAGGGLWVSLGDAVAHGQFNALAAASEIFPLRLDEPAGDEADRNQFISIRPPLTPHPATRLLTDTQRLDLDRVHVYRRHRFASGSQTAGLADEFGTLFSTDNGEPLAVEYMLGRGRIIVQAIPMTPAWSTLPISQSWVVMSQEWLWRLAEPKTTHWNIQPGGVFETSLANVAADAKVADPTGRISTLAARERHGENVFRFTRTAEPGRYELRAARRGDDLALPFNVWRDPAESDLAPLDPAQLAVIAAAAGLGTDNDPLRAATAAVKAPISEPAWSWLLQALLLILIFESILAAVLTRRRNDRSPGMADKMAPPSPGESFPVRIRG